PPDPPRQGPLRGGRAGGRLRRPRGGRGRVCGQPHPGGAGRPPGRGLGGHHSRGGEPLHPGRGDESRRDPEASGTDGGALGPARWHRAGFEGSRITYPPREVRPVVQGGWLLVILLAAIVFIIWGTAKLRLHAFLVLLLAAYGVGLVAGLPANDVIGAITSGF